MDKPDFPMPVTTGNLEAMSISVMLSTRQKCNGRCKACISRNTGDKNNDDIVECDLRILEPHFRMAAVMRARHLILTNQSDPFQERDIYLGRVISLAKKCGIPKADIHTNGLVLHLNRGKATLKDLVDIGLTNITFSIASFDEEANREFIGVNQRPEEIIRFARSLGLVVRCSLLLTKETVHDIEGIQNYIRIAKECGAKFVVIRELWIPEMKRIHTVSDPETYQWCQGNQVPIAPLIEDMGRLASENDSDITELKPLPWGQRVFDVGDINTTFAYCFEGQSGQTIKSLVAKPDGYLSRGWDNKADVLY